MEAGAPPASAPAFRVFIFPPEIAIARSSVNNLIAT